MVASTFGLENNTGSRPVQEGNKNTQLTPAH
jgi:hypothetical protein